MPHCSGVDFQLFICLYVVSQGKHDLSVMWSKVSLRDSAQLDFININYWKLQELKAQIVLKS